MNLFEVKVINEKSHKKANDEQTSNNGVEKTSHVRLYRANKKLNREYMYMYASH